MYSLTYSLYLIVIFKKKSFLNSIVFVNQTQQEQNI